MDFPSLLEFSEVVPLSYSVSKNIILKNSENYSYAFDIKIHSPHAYIRVDPCCGKVSPNSTFTIVVTYQPRTYGSSSLKMKFTAKCIDNYEMRKDLPITRECLVYGRSVPGLIEKKEMVAAQERVNSRINEMCNQINSSLSETIGGSGLHSRPLSSSARLFDATGTTKFKETDEARKTRFNAYIFSNDSKGRSAQRKMKKEMEIMRNDPVLTMLNSTFHARNTFDALTGVLKEKTLGNMLSNDPESTESPPLLPGATVVLPESGKKVLAASVATVRPRGPGSGAVFDAGSEWMSLQFREKHKARVAKHGERKWNHKVWT